MTSRGVTFAREAMQLRHSGRPKISTVMSAAVAGNSWPFVFGEVPRPTHPRLDAESVCPAGQGAGLISVSEGSAPRCGAVHGRHLCAPRARADGRDDAEPVKLAKHRVTARFGVAGQAVHTNCRVCFQQVQDGRHEAHITTGPGGAGIGPWSNRPYMESSFRAPSVTRCRAERRPPRCWVPRSRCRAATLSRRGGARAHRPLSRRLRGRT